MTDLNMTPAALNAAAQGDLQNFLVAATPGGIEAQEARGQTVFANSDVLPKRFVNSTQAQFEQLGFEFGQDVDDLFLQAKLPEGWKKEPTPSFYWTDILDNKGRIRASVFYKAAFYDRDASIVPECRYSIDAYASCDADGNLIDTSMPQYWAIVLKDGKKIVKTFGFHKARDYDTARAIEEQAREWTYKHYPDWRNPFAYWED